MKPKRTVILGAAGTLIIALTGLLGYISGVRVLGSIWPDYMPMAPSAAICFIILSVALLRHARNPWQGRGLMAIASLVFLVTLFGLLNVVGNLLGMDLNFEKGLFPTVGLLGQIPVGGMSSATGATFMLAGLGAVLLLLSQISRHARRLGYWTASFGVLTVLAGATVLMAYLFGTPLMYGGTTVPMAATTAIAFIFLGIALVAAAGSGGFPKRLASGVSNSVWPVACIFILLAVAIAATGLMSYRSFEHDFHAQVEQEISSIADLKMRELVHWRAERLMDAEILHRDPVFAVMVQSFFKNPDDPLAKTRVKVILENYRIYANYEHVRLLDADGRTRLSSTNELQPVSSAVARHIPDALQSKQVTMVDFYRDDMDHDIDLAILVPMIDAQADNQTIGLVAFSIDSRKTLYPFLQRWPIPSATAEILLVRRDGDTALFLNQLRFQKDTALTLRIPLEKSEFCVVKAVLGQQGIVEGVDYRGKQVLADLSAVPDTPWFMVVKIDTAEAYAPLRARWRETLGLIGIGILVLGVGFFVIWRRQQLLFYRVKAGLADALRQNLDRAESSRRAMLSTLEDQKRAEENLRQVTDRLVLATKAANVGIWDLDVVHNKLIWDDAMYRLYGTTSAEFTGAYEAWKAGVLPQDLARADEEVQMALRGEKEFNSEFRVVWPDKSVHYIKANALVQRDASGRPVRMVGTNWDLTERMQADAEHERIEEQLRAAQKLESIGSLAGGIAHDFNNLLGVIIGYCELSLPTLKDDDPTRGNLIEIREAGERAAALTRQLLAFSRRQVLQPKVFNLNEVLGGMERMIGRLIGENISVTTFADPELGQVKADPGQMEQVIMNLAVNARDAMPQGGKLTLETKNVTLDRTGTDWAPDVREGSYVMMTVSDTGTGMDAKTKAQIFEPFFTTKERGKGTGLGLSTVYGIIKQSGGHVSVYSEPGQGTSVKVYLPRVEKKTESLTPPDIQEASTRGAETVLVVEDEERLRKLVCRILRDKGFTDLPASSGREALQLSKTHKGPIHLLLTDVIMPGLSGRETADALKLQRPETKVLYMSGYTDDAIIRHGVLEEGVQLLPKPFTPEELAKKVREVLGV